MTPFGRSGIEMMSALRFSYFLYFILKYSVCPQEDRLLLTVRCGMLNVMPRYAAASSVERYVHYVRLYGN